jgi:3-oxoacyl-[acyl-carrier protein] reductase
VPALRDGDAAAETVECLRRDGAAAFALQANLEDPVAAARLVDESAERLAGLDVLVVNHGIWKRASIDRMTPEQWNETLATNLGAAYGLCGAAARIMIPRRSGAMVLVASTAGQRGEAHHSHYAASKGGLLAFTKSLASELAPYGIRVNAVSPGWVLTDMSRGALEGPEAASSLGKIPLGRPGTPDEIAGPVAFLASDLSSYLYGEILCVNGGAVMTG